MVWQRLQHPNVLPFYGICLELFKSRPVLILPWMENGNLNSYLKRHPELPRNGIVMLRIFGIIAVPLLTIGLCRSLASPEDWNTCIL